MTQEDRKFLDLDMVAHNISNEVDRSLFLEALTCYHVGSHRAAIILTWSATANCIRRRIEELASEQDGPAGQALAALRQIDGTVRYEQTLLDKGQDCELYNKFEKKCLTFARDQRSNCAHPTGYSPSAEAVRYILFVCSQYVLCIQGFRGIAYIRDIVTFRFDNPYFLPKDPLDITQSCKAIIDRIPKRLLPQIPRLACQERPNQHTEIWRENAIKFFSELLAHADDNDAARTIALGLQGYEQTASDLFSILIGLNTRVAQFYEPQQRSQARRQLASQISQGKPNSYEVNSWASLCAVDGFGQEDQEILRNRFAILALELAGNETLLDAQREVIATTVVSLIQNDLLSSFLIAEGCKHLFRSRLFYRLDELTVGAIQEIINRFTSSDNHRNLIESIETWYDDLLVVFIDHSETFLEECDENDPDDVLLLFEAVRELAKRNPVKIPGRFTEITLNVLQGGFLADWRDVDSSLGQNFRSQVSLLINQYSNEFEILSEQAPELLESTFEDDEIN